MQPLNKLTDAELLDLVKQDNHAAFTEIYQRYWKTMYLSAYQVCRRRHDSFEVCQALFVWFWENRERIQVVTSLKGYLHTAVNYKIANMIRNGKAHETLFDDLRHLDKGTFDTHEMEIRELKNLIDQLINELPDRCREVFLLSRNEHLTHREIAERLGIAEKTVDGQISRALKKLRIPLGRLASIFLLF